MQRRDAKHVFYGRMKLLLSMLVSNHVGLVKE